MAITVTTPRGQIIRTTTKSGAVKVELSWNPNFAPQKSQNFLPENEKAVRFAESWKRGRKAGRDRKSSPERWRP